MKQIPSILLGALGATAISACSPQTQSHGPEACANTPDGVVTAVHAWARSAPSKNAMSAVYMTLCNGGGEADALIGASADVAGVAEIHMTSTDAGGISSMRPEKEIALPPHGRAVLKPGGAHIMLMGLAGPIAPDQEVSVTLTFRNAPPLTLTAKARAPDQAATMSRH